MDSTITEPMWSSVVLRISSFDPVGTCGLEVDCIDGDGIDCDESV